MAKGNFGGGNGSELDPFLIEDVNDFLAIGNFSNHQGLLAFEQTSNLDLKDVIDFKPFDLRYADIIYNGNDFKLENLSFRNNSTATVFHVVSSMKLENIVFSKIKLQGVSASIIGSVYGDRSKTHIFRNINILECEFNAEYGQSASLILYSYNYLTITGDFIFENCTVNNCEFIGAMIGAFGCQIQSINVKMSQCRVLNSNFGGSYNGYLYVSFFLYSHNSQGLGMGSVSYENCYAKGNNIDMSNVTGNLRFAGFLCYYVNKDVTTTINVDKCYLDNDFKIQHNNLSDNLIEFCGITIDGGYQSNCNLFVNDFFLLGSVDINTTDQIRYGFVGEIAHNIGDNFRITTNNVKKLNTFSLPPNQPYNSKYDNQIQNTINSEESKQRSTYEDLAHWDFDKIWSINEDLSTPYFKLKRALITCKRVPLTNYRR